MTAEFQLAGQRSEGKLGSGRSSRFFGFLTVLFLGLWTQAAGYCSVVINEVHYNPPAPDGRDLEFIELYNSGPVAVSLEGLKLEGGVYF